MNLLTLLHVLPLAGVALGQSIPSAGVVYEVGSPLTIQWGETESLVTIVLETGVPHIPASGITITSMY